MQYLFDEIDSVLFEQNSDGPQYIKKECQEWQFQFPHLRFVLVKNILRQTSKNVTFSSFAGLFDTY